MDSLQFIIDFVLHIDAHLIAIVGQYGVWTYGILFLIIFVETGLVVTPFLPGDSLLFAAGALAATGVLNPWLLIALLFIAAVLGDSVNYAAGSYFGMKVFREDAKVFKIAYLKKTEDFFEKFGGKTILLARFVPIVRTYAPFVAGASRMHYPRFVFYNILGGGIWVGAFILLGYLFGNIPIVKNNFGITVFVIIALSLIPIFVEFIRNVRKRRLISKRAE